MKIKNYIILLSIPFLLNAEEKKEMRLTDSQKLESSFASVEKKEIILIKGKDLSELLTSFKKALVLLPEEEQKELLMSMKRIIRKNIIEEEKTLIGRTLTKTDIEEIKFNSLNGKTVLDIIGEGNEIKAKAEKEKLEEERRLKASKK